MIKTAGFCPSGLAWSVMAPTEQRVEVNQTFHVDGWILIEEGQGSL